MAAGETGSASGKKTGAVNGDPWTTVTVAGQGAEGFEEEELVIVVQHTFWSASTALLCRGGR